LQNRKKYLKNPFTNGKMYGIIVPNKENAAVGVWTERGYGTGNLSGSDQKAEEQSQDHQR
jgi:hypothetical protein